VDIKKSLNEEKSSLLAIGRSILRHISVLKEKGIIKRIGPAKGGHWEVIEK